MRVVLLALEVQHGVHDVLQRLRAGEAPVLRHVPDEKGRNILPLRGEEQLRGRLAHLADAAGGGLEAEREHGLDRVDDDERGTEARDLLEDALEARLGEDVEGRLLDPEPLAARLDLMLGFLARAVEHRPDGARKVRRGLQEERGLADARLAADQDERSRHDTAAEHAIEFADAGGNPLGDDRVDVGVELRSVRSGQRVPLGQIGATHGDCRRRPLLHHRIPRPAVGAAPEPLGGLRAAFLAGEDGFRGLHGDGDDDNTRFGGNEAHGDSYTETRSARRRTEERPVWRRPPAACGLGASLCGQPRPRSISQ